jgi:PAS domain S-box-containing protein
MKSMKSKILIVEHDSSNMELIQDELKKSKINYTSEIVQTKKEYVKALHEFKPDIILSNYTFPTFDGPAAFKIKKKLSPETPFIFVSESIGEEVAVELIKNGVSDFVLKESLSTLPTKLNHALKKATISKLSFKNKQKEEKRIEELGYNAQKYYFLIESSMDAILLTIKDGKILNANTAACEIFQMTREEIYSAERSGILDTTDPRLQQLLEERDRTGKAKGELTFLRKDGSRFPGEISSVVFMDADGQEKTSVTIRDISERRQAEKALKQSEKKYRQIVETSHEGIWAIDENHKTTFANKKMGEILEYTPEEMLGKEIYSFMDQEGKKIAIEIMENTKKGHSDQKQIKYISKSGKEVWTNITVNPFINSKGIYKGCMTMVTDITEKKKNKEKVEQLNIELAFQNKEKENRAAELITTNTKLLKTNRELDHFVYSISHDLRSPLTTILGLVAFIEEESLEPDTLEHIGMIRSSVNRLDEFIKNILSYSRNNRTGLEIVQIPLQKTTAEIVDSLRSIKNAENIRFEIDIKEQHPFYSDRLRLNTLLENLVSNAIKYHKTDLTDCFIKIIGHSDQDKLFLSIIDNGIGIAGEHHQKIFDMFFRLCGKKNGSGIGLYIVKETVQILKGTIQVHSEEGKGTTFNITLKNLKP